MAKTVVEIKDSVIIATAGQNTLIAKYKGTQLTQVLGVQLDKDYRYMPTAEEVETALNAPIEKEFPMGTPETASIHTVVELLDSTRVALLKHHHGKPNVVTQLHEESKRKYASIIEVGTQGSYRIGSDIYPCIVTNVSKTGKQVTVHMVETKAIGVDKWGDVQYSFSTSPVGEPLKAYHGNYGYKNGYTTFSFRGFDKSLDRQF